MFYKKIDKNKGMWYNKKRKNTIIRFVDFVMKKDDACAEYRVYDEKKCEEDIYITGICRYQR